jgi:integrase
MDDGCGRLRLANAPDFRHGAAVNQVLQGTTLNEVQQQFGHARIDSTTIYTKLANPERRRHGELRCATKPAGMVD